MELLDVVGRVFDDVLTTFVHNWPYLLISLLAATALSVYVGSNRISGWLNRRLPVAIGGAVVLATITPFCSCGTTAVVLGMLTTSSPWAPIVAFMVASPLTSPAELFLSAGLFGWPFAWIFFLGTIGLGASAGVGSWLLDRKGWLANQSRMKPSTAGGCGSSCGTSPEPVATSCCDPVAPAVSASCCGDEPLGVARTATMTVDFRTATTTVAPARISWAERLRVRDFADELKKITKRFAIFFFGFATIGYLVIELIPTTWLTTYLGGESIGSIVLAAALAIPIYVNSDASLPLVAALMDGGMGVGAAMAFLVTGAGTSVGAISGMLLIARWRVVALVIGTLFTGAVALGLITDALLG